jgi:hypothetical protein
MQNAKMPHFHLPTKGRKNVVDDHQQANSFILFGVKIMNLDVYTFHYILQGLL